MIMESRVIMHIHAPKKGKSGEQVHSNITEEWGDKDDATFNTHAIRPMKMVTGMIGC